MPGRKKIKKPKNKLAGRGKAISKKGKKCQIKRALVKSECMANAAAVDTAQPTNDPTTQTDSTVEKGECIVKGSNMPGMLQNKEHVSWHVEKTRTVEKVLTINELDGSQEVGYKVTEIAKGVVIRKTL